MKIAYFLQIKKTDLWQCTIRTPTAPSTFPFHCPMLSGSYCCCCCCCRRNKLQLERLRSLSASGQRQRRNSSSRCQLLLPIMLCFRFWPIGHLSPCALWTFAIGPRHCQKQRKRKKRKRSWKSSIKRVRTAILFMASSPKGKGKGIRKGLHKRKSDNSEAKKSFYCSGKEFFFYFPFSFNTNRVPRLK